VSSHQPALATPLSAFLMLGALLLAGLACDEDPAGPTDSDPGPGLVGTVVDTDGVPVAGAPVGLIYGLPGFTVWSDWPPAAWPEEEDCDQPGSLTYRFGIEAASTVTLQILDHRGRRVRRLIEALTLPAANHEIIWRLTDDAGALVPNGAYRSHLEVRRSGFEEVVDSELRLLNALSVDYANCIGPVAITDDEGRFRIPYAAMPIGAEVDEPFESEAIVVPDTLWIQSATPAGRARQLLRITDLETDQDLTLILEPGP
jgi:hypothetical protein